MKRFRFRVHRTKRGGVLPAAEFDLEIEGKRTILDALETIERTIDPSLVFRHSCHHGSCGTCAVRVNGVERLACRTSIESLESDLIVVEPLSGFPVMADLAVDRRPFFGELPPGTTHLRASETDGLVRFENCIECGACVSACPVSETFVGPAALAAAAREIANNPERKQELLDFAAGPRGVDGCVGSFACSRVCPLQVYPSRKIIDLRDLTNRHRRRL